MTTIDTYAANEAMRAHAQATYGMRAPRLEGTLTEQAYQAATHAQTMFPRYLERIDQSKFTAEGLQDVYAQFGNTDTAKAFEASVAQVRDRRDQTAAKVEHLKRELSPAGDTATELRNTRYWNQTVKILDAVQDATRLSKIAGDLIANADRAQLGVLLQELEPYMQARVQQYNNPHLRETLATSYTKAVEAALGKAIPEYTKAKRQAVNAEKVFQITEHNARTMRKYFASPTGRPVLIDPRKYDPDR